MSLKLTSQPDLSGYLLLDQSSQQTVSGGTGPLFSTGLNVSAGQYFNLGSANARIGLDAGTPSIHILAAGASPIRIDLENTSAGGLTEVSSTHGSVEIFSSPSDAGNHLLLQGGFGGAETIQLEDTGIFLTSAAGFTVLGATSLSSLSSNGFVKTSGGTGLLTVDTSTYLTAEADTLATVTGRGATTGTAISITGNATHLTLGTLNGGVGQTGTIRLNDGQHASNYVSINTSKLSTSFYTAQYPDAAAGTHTHIFGTAGSGNVAYGSSSTDLTSSKNLTFSGSTLTIGAGGSDGFLALYSEQGATDYICTLAANTAMTASTTFYFPAAAPGATYIMTMTSGGVMGFDSSTYLTTSAAASTYVELAGDTMTGGLVLPAGTTSLVPLRIPAGAAHSSQTEGNIWNDSTQKAIQTYVDGVKQTQTTCLFTATADADVAGGVEGTTETSLIGTGVGTLTLPANFLVAGKTIRVTVRGYVTTAATSNTCTFRAKLGSVAVITSAASAPTTGQSNRSWFATFDMTCRTTGATGTVYGQGSIVNLIGTSFTSIATTKMLEFSSTSAAVVDTTSSNAIDFTLQLGGTNADTWTSTDVTVEVLN